MTEQNAYTVLVPCAFLVKDMYVIIKEHPCKILKLTRTYHSAKYGRPKTIMQCLDLFSGEKLEEIRHNHSVIPLPLIKQTTYELKDISAEGYCSLLNKKGQLLRLDVKLPVGELGDKLKEIFKGEARIDVTVLTVAGREVIGSYVEKCGIDMEE